MLDLNIVYNLYLEKKKDGTFFGGSDSEVQHSFEYASDGRVIEERLLVYFDKTRPFRVQLQSSSSQN